MGGMVRRAMQMQNEGVHAQEQPTTRKVPDHGSARRGERDDTSAATDADHDGKMRSGEADKGAEGTGARTIGTRSTCTGNI